MGFLCLLALLHISMNAFSKNFTFAASVAPNFLISYLNVVTNSKPFVFGFTFYLPNITLNIPLMPDHMYEKNPVT